MFYEQEQVLVNIESIEYKPLPYLKCKSIFFSTEWDYIFKKNNYESKH